MSLLRNAGELVSDKGISEARLGNFYEEEFSTAYALLIQTKRTPAQYVGAVMAMLAVFDQVHVLPPESSPKANQLIRSLIQFQSAFMNRDAQLVQQYVSEAFTTQLGRASADVSAQFSANGWTSISMEALVDYSALHPFWNTPAIRADLGRYNLSPSDWDLVVEIFTQAREQFRRIGQDLHESFAIQRRSMPGGQ